jgi:hypothetical protein
VGVEWGDMDWIDLICNEITRVRYQLYDVKCGMRVSFFCFGILMPEVVPV